MYGYGINSRGIDDIYVGIFEFIIFYNILYKTYIGNFETVFCNMINLGNLFKVVP